MSASATQGGHNNSQRRAKSERKRPDVREDAGEIRKRPSVIMMVVILTRRHKRRSVADLSDHVSNKPRNGPFSLVGADNMGYQLADRAHAQRTSIRRTRKCQPDGEIRRLTASVQLSSVDAKVEPRETGGGGARNCCLGVQRFKGVWMAAGPRTTTLTGSRRLPQVRQVYDKASQRTYTEAG